MTDDTIGECAESSPTGFVVLMVGARSLVETYDRRDLVFEGTSGGVIVDVLENLEERLNGVIFEETESEDKCIIEVLEG